jgi:hypothetical protein
MKLIGVKITAVVYNGQADWREAVAYERLPNVDLMFVDYGYGGDTIGKMFDLYSGGPDMSDMNFARIDNATLDNLLWAAYLDVNETTKQELYDELAYLSDMEIVGYLYLASGKSYFVLSAKYEGLSPLTWYFYNIQPKGYGSKLLVILLLLVEEINVLSLVIH